ncbi:MAG: sensor histidine kinase [Desulfobacterales bacterium]|nr:sensor histidine kinase [Desulfobacterales bacterium]
MIFRKLKPRFLDHKDVTAGPYKHHFDFLRIWKRAILVIATVALVPLIIWAFSGYRLTMETIESELAMRTSQLVSNSWQSASLFLTERRSVLDFIAHDHTLETLKDSARLADILDNLNKRFGGFMDLGVIDGNGKQINQVGSHQMEGLDYYQQPWFRRVLNHGVYVSELVTGYRNEPHLDFAVMRKLPNGSFFVLRAALKPEQLKDSIAQIEVGEKGDLFIINHEGVLQTPSRYYGPILTKMKLAVPEYSPKTHVYENINADQERIVIGYAYIPDTPFILMMIQEQSERIQPWYKTTWAFTGILAASIIVILLVTLGVATHLVNQIHKADQERVDTLHQVEYANKMVSLGRLASGVAHEINNPLAIINEKAGHIRDIFTLTTTYAKDPKLVGLVDSVISTVQRCAEVTRGLLNFARHLNLSVQTINLKEIIDEVKSVLTKEAEHRSISVDVKVSENIPPFESDRGKLEQIFFNLFNNAIGNMNDGGHLEITARREDKRNISITFSDNGRGIPEADLKHIFEPFFYTKTGEGLTGLGLSVTYALVQEIGGKISVQSQLGKGTSFTIRIPLELDKNNPKDSSVKRKMEL